MSGRRARQVRAQKANGAVFAAMHPVQRLALMFAEREAFTNTVLDSMVNYYRNRDGTPKEIALVITPE